MLIGGRPGMAEWLYRENGGISVIGVIGVRVWRPVFPNWREPCIFALQYAMPRTTTAVRPETKSPNARARDRGLELQLPGEEGIAAWTLAGFAS